MDISTSNTGPTIINASGYIGWKIIYYLFRKVSCRDTQLLGAAAKAPHHLATAEVRQVPHDAVRLGFGLRPRPRVRRGRQRGGAGTPDQPGDKDENLTGWPGGADDTPWAVFSRRWPNRRYPVTQRLCLGSWTPPATAEVKCGCGRGAHGAGRRGRAPSPPSAAGLRTLPQPDQEPQRPFGFRSPAPAVAPPPAIARDPPIRRSSVSLNSNENWSGEPIFSLGAVKTQFSGNPKCFFSLSPFHYGPDAKERRSLSPWQLTLWSSFIIHSLFKHLLNENSISTVTSS